MPRILLSWTHTRILLSWTHTAIETATFKNVLSCLFLFAGLMNCHSEIIIVIYMSPVYAHTGRGKGMQLG